MDLFKIWAQQNCLLNIIVQTFPDFIASFVLLSHESKEGQEKVRWWSGGQVNVRFKGISGEV